MSIRDAIDNIESRDDYYSLHKILISDDSFLIADDNYQLTIFCKMFNLTFKRRISVYKLMRKKDYHKYFMIDVVNNENIIRYFTIEPYINDEVLRHIPIGSRIKMSQDIKIGDLIQGPNNEPKTVNTLHNGQEEMFNIKINDKIFTVNGGHILELVDKNNGEHLQIPVNIYMLLDQEFKDAYAMENVQ